MLQCFFFTCAVVKGLILVQGGDVMSLQCVIEVGVHIVTLLVECCLDMLILSLRLLRHNQCDDAVLMLMCSCIEFQ